jgi:hypothetical protein
MKVGSIRVAKAGTRQIIMVNALDVCAFLDAKHGPNVAKTLFHKVPSWVSVAKEADLQEFHDAGYKIFAATVGAGDMVYCPSGWAVTYTVHDGAHCVGFRVGCLSLKCADVMKIIQSSYTATGKESKVVGQILEHLQVLKPAGTNAEALADKAQDHEGSKDGMEEGTGSQVGDDAEDPGKAIE